MFDIFFSFFLCYFILKLNELIRVWKVFNSLISYPLDLYFHSNKVLVDILPLASGYVNQHIFSDLDPGPKHCFPLKHCTGHGGLCAPMFGKCRL